MGNRLIGLRDRLAVFERRHPLFCAALVTVGAVFSISVSLGLGIAWIMVGGLLAAWLGRWKLSLAWLLCALLAAGVFITRTTQRDRQEQQLVKAGILSLHAKAVGDPRGDAEFWSVAATVTTGPHTGAKVWWKGEGSLPVKGSILSAMGIATPLTAPRNPGEFDRATWMKRQSIAAVFAADDGGTRIVTGGLAEWCASLKKGFHLAITDGLEENSPAAKVLRAVIIGEISPDSDELVSAYRNSGTLHVFSVSGLHVAMAAAIVWFVLKWCRVRRRHALFILIAVVFGYSWITGNSPPALRSAWMTAIFLSAFILRRKGNLLNSLGAVLLIGTLWDGRLIFQPGVQLSYGVVAAIAVGIKFTDRFFSPIARPELYLPTSLMNRRQVAWLKIRQWFANYFSVSTTAWAGSTPLTIWHFGVVTPVSILAGLPILPAVFVMLVVGLFSATLHPVLPAASRLLNKANGRMADLTTWMAEGFSSIPGGHFMVRDSGPFVLVYDLKYGAGATCFSAGDGSGLLLDAGDRVGFKSVIAPSLRNLNVTPDSVVLSHPDGGHLGGGEKIWETFPIRQAVMPVERSRSPAFRMWRAEAPAAGVKLIPASKGQRLPLGDGAWLETLLAPDTQAVNAEADERVAIFRLHWRGWKILFTNDAGIDTEQRLLAAGGDVSADVIICGRPRHDANLSDELLAAVSPRAIVASNATFPYAERVPAAQMAYWKSRGIRVMDQLQAGGVTLRVEKSGELVLTGFLDRSEIRLRR